MHKEQPITRILKGRYRSSRPRTCHITCTGMLSTGQRVSWDIFSSVRLSCCNFHRCVKAGAQDLCMGFFQVCSAKESWCGRGLAPSPLVACTLSPRLPVKGAQKQHAELLAEEPVPEAAQGPIHRYNTHMHQTSSMSESLEGNTQDPETEAWKQGPHLLLTPGDPQVSFILPTPMRWVLQGSGLQDCGCWSLEGHTFFRGPCRASTELCGTIAAWAWAFCV